MEINIEADAESFPWQSVYKLMIGSIVPRPIGWISTVNSEGHPNLAPFSFFNAICANPPHVLFCPAIRAADHSEKDTLRNIRETGEFVVNIVTEATAEAMNITATELPADVDEFEYAGLTPIASSIVKPPRVAESPVHYECVTTQIIEIGNDVGGASVVIGRVVQIHVADDLIYGGDKIDIKKLQPVGRLAGNSYVHVNDIFDLIRPASQVKKNNEK